MFWHWLCRRAILRYWYWKQGAFFAKNVNKSSADRCIYILWSYKSCEVIKILANFDLKYMQRIYSYNFIASLLSLDKRFFLKKKKTWKNSLQLQENVKWFKNVYQGLLRTVISGNTFEWFPLNYPHTVIRKTSFIFTSV